MPPQYPYLDARNYRVFDDEQIVSAQTALFDKCEVSVGGWSISGSNEQIAEHVSRFSDFKVSDGHGGETKLFETRRAQKERNWHTLKVLGKGAGEGIKYPHPVFSGLLKLNKSTHQISNRWDLVFHLNLNINRTIQAQPLPSSGVRRVGRRSQPIVLAISKQAVLEVRERFLAPWNNMLAHTRRRLSYASSKVAEEHLRDCVTSIFNQVEDGFRPLSSLPREGFDLSDRDTRRTTVSLHHLEVCWDFYHEQPILAVDVFKQMVKANAQHVTSQNWRELVVKDKLRYDSQSVSVYLKNGLEIKFYAKTETTLRFEVVYFGENIKDFKPAPGILSLDQAVETCRDIRRDAALHLNTLFSLIGNEDDLSHDDATPEELIDAVQAETRDVGRTCSILARIVRNRRISPYPNDPDYEVLRRLKRKGVLVNNPASPGRRNYVIAARYEHSSYYLLSKKIIRRRFVSLPKPDHKVKKGGLRLPSKGLST